MNNTHYEPVLHVYCMNKCRFLS